MSHIWPVDERCAVIKKKRRKKLYGIKITATIVLVSVAVYKLKTSFPLSVCQFEGPNASSTMCRHFPCHNSGTLHIRNEEAKQEKSALDFLHRNIQ